MALTQIPIGNTGAKFAYDREAKPSYRKAILADGKEVNVNFSPDGSYSFRNELSFQRDALKTAKNLLEDYQERIVTSNEILASPTATEAAKKRAARNLDFDSAGLVDMQRQVQEKTEFIAKLEEIQGAGLQKVAETEVERQQQVAMDKKQGESQTAEQKATNDNPPANPGAGTPPATGTEPQKLSDAEAAKLKNANTGKTEQAVTTAQNPASAKTLDQTNADVLSAITGKSESRATQNEVSDATKQQKAGTVQGAGVGGQKSAADSAKADAASTVKKYNILNDYTSYTYRITLFFLEKRDYNSLASNPSTFTPKFALVSSAGGYGNPVGPDQKIGDNYIRGTGRHPDFLDDFFIDNLTMTTVTGLNAKTKASNAMDINFTITEPHGMSLLDRLLSACETSEDKNPNYIDQPYLLQIDFLASPSDPAYNNSKDSNRLIDRKRIAIKLAGLKIKPSTGGTVYQCTAIPYNHTAFNMTVASVPSPLSIEAGTVGEFFGTAADMANVFNTDTALSTDERIESALKQWADEVQNVGGVPPTEAELAIKRRSISDAFQYTSKSFTGAYNSFQEDIRIKQKGSKIAPTKIAFNIPDDIIANSPIVEADNSQASNATMIDPKQSVGTIDINYKRKSVFQIQQGTSIIDVIDRVLKNSDYIKNQIKTQNELIQLEQANAAYDSANARQEVNPSTFKFLDWFKVIPQVVLNDFDFLRNAYSKTILYSIMPYKAANQYHPNFQKTKIKGQQVVRTYDYLYTGKNSDIISVNVDFDTSFYTQLSTYRDQVKRGGSNRASDENDVKDDEYGLVQTNTTRPDPVPVPIEYAGSNASGGSMNAATSPDAQVVADLSKSLYSSMRGDMLNIKLTIFGDPAFIKQDDIYYNPGSPVDYREFNLTGSQGSANVPINAKTGQIVFDKEQVFVQFNIKNYVDINDNVGIVNKQTRLRNGRDTNGTFSGVYKLQRVDNTFSRGQFTQVLDLVRMPDTILNDESVPTKNPGVTTPATSNLKNAGDVFRAAQNGNSSSSVPPASDPAAPAVDPKLKSAANQPPTVTPEQTGGAGTPKENSQPSSTAPSKSGDAPAVAPQEKAPEPQADTVPSLSKLSADFDRIFNKPDGFTRSTTPEQARAAGFGVYWQETAGFNNRIVAARLNPDKATALQEEIKIKVERQVYYEQVSIYTGEKISNPAKKIVPEPTQFIVKVLTTALGEASASADQSLKQVNELYGQLKTLNPAAAEDFLKTKDKLYADAKTAALAKI